MRDGIDALHRVVQGPRVCHAPLDDLDPGTGDHCLPPAMHQGANDHTVLGERGNQLASDEAGGTGDQHPSGALERRHNRPGVAKSPCWTAGRTYFT